MNMRLLVLLSILLASLLTACGGTTAPPAASPTLTKAPTPVPTAAGDLTATEARVATPSPPAPVITATPPARSTSSSGEHLVLKIVAEASEARYRVREQLLGRSLPNDAVGRTRAIDGQIAFTNDGSIDVEQSFVTVDLTTLQSDEARRDNYIKQNTLEVARYPQADFRPTRASGLPWPLPSSGEVTFQLTGDLTVHGVTKSVTWNVTATFDSSTVSGTATTAVTFADFGMVKPRVPILLSLEDTIGLELDFQLEPVS